MNMSNVMREILNTEDPKYKSIQRAIQNDAIEKNITLKSKINQPIFAFVTMTNGTSYELYSISNGQDWTFLPQRMMNIMGKRSDHSMRTVISPNTDIINIDEYKFLIQ